MRDILQKKQYYCFMWWKYDRNICYVDGRAEELRNPNSKIHRLVEKGRYSCIDKRLAVALQWFRTGALIRVPRHQLHRGRFVDLFPTRCPAE